MTLMLAGVITLLLAVIGLLGWKYYEVSNKSQTEVAKETTSRLVGKVSKLYLVPTNEQPTVAQIQDKSKLGSQAFFKNAKNGDYLLIYTKEKVALIYRESTNQLINVGPVNIGDNTQTQDTTKTDSTKPSSNP